MLYFLFLKCLLGKYVLSHELYVGFFSKENPILFVVHLISKIIGHISCDANVCWILKKNLHYHQQHSTIISHIQLSFANMNKICIVIILKGEKQKQSFRRIERFNHVVSCNNLKKNKMKCIAYMYSKSETNNSRILCLARTYCLRIVD